MVGVAVIGVGGWGQNHARVTSYLKADDLISSLIFVDINRDRVKYIAKKFGAEYSTNIDEVLKREDIDAVIISTPTPLHYAHGKKVIEAGKHLLMEKPLTETVEQAKELIRLAKEQNLVFMVGFLLRYSVATRYLKEMYEKKKLGKVFTILAKRTGFMPTKPTEFDVVKDLAIHDIDLIRFIFNKKPLAVVARGGGISKGSVDFASLFIEYADEHEKNLTHAILEVNRITTPFKIRRMEITAEKAVTILDLQQHVIQIMNEKGVFIPKLKVEEPLYLEDKNFVLSVMKKEKPLVTAEDGLIALSVCEEALKMIELGKFEVKYLRDIYEL